MVAYTKTERLAEAVRARIAAGEFQPGGRIPTGPALAAQYDVSGKVVRAAMKQLEADGVIVSRQGGGRFVRKDDES